MTTIVPSALSASFQRFSVLQALSAGAVPSTGLRHIRVGREQELDSIRQDLRRVSEGFGRVRFVTGRRESGKTFFLHLARNAALEQGFVVARASLSLYRRLSSATGHARALYAELMDNLSMSEHQEGAPLAMLLDAWVARVTREAKDAGGDDDAVRRRVALQLRPLTDELDGIDFAQVLERYAEASLTRDDRLRQSALRWLCGQCASREEAHSRLGVASYIDDHFVRSALRLFAHFVRLAGYSGLLVTLDDLTVVPTRLRDPGERGEQYDEIVELLRESLEGRLGWMMILFAIEFAGVSDRYRGLYSNDALARWLAPNRFATNGFKDLASPLIHLNGLDRGDLEELLAKVRDMFASGHPAEGFISDDGIGDFIDQCTVRVGERYLDSPRQVVKDFLDLLHLVGTQEHRDWRTLLESADLVPEPIAAELHAGLDVHGSGSLRGRWYLPGPIRTSRRTRHLAAVTAGVTGTVLLLLAGLLGGWWGLSLPPLSADVQIKWGMGSEGLRAKLEPDRLPLALGQFYSIEASFSEPCYPYVVVVDPFGRIEIAYDGGSPPALTNRVQVPGGDRMFLLEEPAGMRTVLVFGTRSALHDSEYLRTRVGNLRPPPVVPPSTMFVFNGVAVAELRSAIAPPAGGPSPPADRGFLDRLSDEFSGRFETVRAVAFPVSVPSTDKDHMTLYDLPNK
jgi:hypothetical protein